MPSQQPDTIAIQPRFSITRGERAGRVDAVSVGPCRGGDVPAHVPFGAPARGAVSRPVAGLARVFGLERLMRRVAGTPAVRAFFCRAFASGLCSPSCFQISNHRSTTMKLHRNRALLAALALGLVSGAVNAQIDLTPETGTAFAPFTYAKESLQKANSFKGKGDNSSTTYYRVTGAGDDLDLTFDAGTRIGAADTGLLEITLTGMAFEMMPTVNDFEVATGGMAGESTVLMRYTGSGVLAAAAAVTIDLNGSDADVVGITDGHSGGVKVELINATLESVLGSGQGPDDGHAA